MLSSEVATGRRINGAEMCIFYAKRSITCFCLRCLF